MKGPQLSPQNFRMAAELNRSPCFFGIRYSRIANCKCLCYTVYNSTLKRNQLYAKAAGYSDTFENIVNHDFIER